MNRLNSIRTTDYLKYYRMVTLDLENRVIEQID